MLLRQPCQNNLYMSCSNSDWPTTATMTCSWHYWTLQLWSNSSSLIFLSLNLILCLLPLPSLFPLPPPSPYTFIYTCTVWFFMTTTPPLSPPFSQVNNNCATGSTALFLAKQLIEGGLAHCILALGFEKMERGSLGSKVTLDPVAMMSSTHTHTHTHTHARAHTHTLIYTFTHT